MRAGRRAIVLSLVVAAGALSAVLSSQARIDPRLLAFKKTLADQQNAAIATPVAGVRTSAGPRSGLFPIRATGVSTEPIRRAAEKGIREAQTRLETLGALAAPPK